jgi:pyruvate/2-oxoglutarate dehydrogenase complex dihydrolipoamide dehydrogenase (E3) component
MKKGVPFGVENIWAMGDCAGPPQFTHVAVNDFSIVYDNLNGGNRTTKIA